MKTLIQQDIYKDKKTDKRVVSIFRANAIGVS